MKLSFFNNFIKVFSVLIITLFISLTIIFSLYCFGFIYDFFEHIGDYTTTPRIFGLFTCLLFIIIIIYLRGYKVINKHIFKMAWFFTLIIPLITFVMPDFLKPNPHYAVLSLRNRETENELNSDEPVWDWEYCRADCDYLKGIVKGTPQNDKSHDTLISYYTYSNKLAILENCSPYSYDKNNCGYDKEYFLLHGNFDYIATFTSKLLFFLQLFFEMFFYFLVSCFVPFLVIAFIISWAYSKIIFINLSTQKNIPCSNFLISQAEIPKLFRETTYRPHQQEEIMNNAGLGDYTFDWFVKKKYLTENDGINSYMHFPYRSILSRFYENSYYWIEGIKVKPLIITALILLVLMGLFIAFYLLNAC